MRWGFGVLIVAVATAGCASGQQWDTWLSKTAHFASKDHMVFSIRNQGGPPRVVRADLVAAREESWWGEPVSVPQEQIQER